MTDFCKSESTHNQASKKSQCSKQQRGFSLLELMAVIAIVSALLAIAIPMYQSYRVRAKIGVGISAMAPLKSAVSIHYQTNGIWPANNADANAKPPASYSNEYVDHSTVDTAPYPGSITLSYNTQALGALRGNNTIIFYPEVDSQRVVWKCDEGTMPARYRPAQCSI